MKFYTPILQMKTGKRDFHGNLPIFTVNGSTSTNREEAIMRASKHVSIRDKEATIIKIDEVDESE